MILFKKAAELRGYLQARRKAGFRLGFVPTMGALHEGHISLISTSQKLTDLTICSIFVNPTQFNNPLDYAKYPITLEKDIMALEKKGVDILFCPTASEIYPQGTQHLEKYELGSLETILEGKFRPGHFQGVCQVIHRFFEILEPTDLFMGEKDYQQCLVVKRLIELTGIKIDFHTNPTLRESDGLAMSSRNMRLNVTQRRRATGIFKALQSIKEQIRPGNQSAVLEKAKSILRENEFNIDYVELADASNLELLHEWDGKKNSIVLIAAYQQDIRLIDNMIISAYN